jgi:hypothetical protein
MTACTNSALDLGAPHRKRPLLRNPCCAAACWLARCSPNVWFVIVPCAMTAVHRYNGTGYGKEDGCVDINECLSPKTNDCQVPSCNQPLVPSGRSPCSPTAIWVHIWVHMLYCLTNSSFCFASLAEIVRRSRRLHHVQR